MVRAGASSALTQNRLVLTRVVLIRHGESENMVKGIVGGRRGDTGLTDAGRRQATSLKERMATVGQQFDAAYTSSLPRVVETARIVLEGIDGLLEAVEDERLAYRWPDHSDGLTWEEHRRRFTRPGGGVFRPYEEGEESWADLVSRVGACLAELTCRHPGRTVVVFTHEEMIDASFRIFGGSALWGAFKVRVTPTSLTEWSTGDDPLGGGPPEWKLPTRRLERCNDAGHLEAS